VLTVCVPDVPVMVTLYCPRLDVAVEVNVIVLYPVFGLGENDAVTPLGSPATESLTLPLNPFCGYTLTQVVPLLPWPMVALPADMLKLGVYTPTGMSVDAVRLPRPRWWQSTSPCCFRTRSP